MKFFARVRTNSAMDKFWRGMHRVSGELLHVKFTLHGQHFVSGELTADEMQNLKHHPSVDIEAFATLPESLPGEPAGAGIAAVAAATTVSLAPPASPLPKPSAKSSPAP